jgi:hypothetical protein
MGKLLRILLLLAALVGLAAPAAARPERGDSGKSESRQERRTPQGARAHVTPYLEVSQAVFAELSPGDDVLTYTNLAAGVDAGIAGRRNRGSVSVRYERRIGWGERASDGDVISGVARVASDVVPGTLQLDAGALAARARVESSGATSLNPLIIQGDNVSNIYSVYAGPTLTTRAGDVALSAAYHAGYTRVETDNGFRPAAGIPALDIFDESTTQVATVSAGVRPYEVAPVGVTASAGWAREDISNLDQRIDQRYLRTDFVLPISLDVALLAGVGYEDVEISSRDALRDAAGRPVIGRNGRIVTDTSQRRKLAYDVDGLIWDAGVMWRPSRRTALEAHVGRRYGSTSVYGTFAYAPDARSALNIGVYDNIAGFGGEVRRALEDLPTDFEVSRNPLTGDLNGCVIGGGQGIGQGQGLCLNPALSSIAASTFRARGIAANYGVNLGRIGAGVGAGYSRRKFIARRDSVLALANGVIDETWWANAWLTASLDPHSSVGANLYANWFQTGLSSAGDATALGANASYFRRLTDRLSATAAVGIDGVEREQPLPDQWGASALVGLRYAL